MAKARAERRQHSDAFKKRAVARLLAGRIGIGEFCDEQELSGSVVRRWARDPRYGGKAGAFSRGANGAANGAKANGAGLPVKAKSYSLRARPAIPTLYACPHCGGPIKMGAEVIA